MIVGTCLPIIPTFVLPYKRYAGPTLLSLAAGYVENEKQSYRQTASPSGRATGYQTPPAAPAIDERARQNEEDGAAEGDLADQLGEIDVF